jgi:alpha-beta hydrolase superfamily lysophospholipase
MRQSEGIVLGLGGLKLFYQAWLPDKAFKTVILIVHGVHENCRHYEHLVDYFVQRGAGVYGYDHRGFGKSEGQVGHVDRFSDYREDLRLVLAELNGLESGAQVYLFCHSMGALIGTDFMEHYSEGFAGAVISGGPYEPVGVASPLLVLIAKAMSALFPRFSINLGIDFGDVTRDPVQRRSLEEDPLVGHCVTARWGTESLRAVDAVKAHAGAIHSPVLFVHGDADKLSALHGTQAFFDSMTYPDKTLKIYPGSYHNIHGDIGWEAEMKDMEEWMAGQASKAGIGKQVAFTSSERQ